MLLKPIHWHIGILAKPSGPHKKASYLWN